MCMLLTGVVRLRYVLHRYRIYRVFPRGFHLKSTSGFYSNRQDTTSKVCLKFVYLYGKLKEKPRSLQEWNSSARQVCKTWLRLHNVCTFICLFLKKSQIVVIYLYVWYHQPDIGTKWVCRSVNCSQMHFIPYILNVHPWPPSRSANW